VYCIYCGSKSSNYKWTFVASEGGYYQFYSVAEDYVGIRRYYRMKPPLQMLTANLFYLLGMSMMTAVLIYSIL